MKETPADTQIRKKEEGGDVAGARKEIPPTAPEQISIHVAVHIKHPIETRCMK